MRRNEVWWAELPRPVGPRPVLILTRNSVLESIDSIVVAVVTRTIRNLPTEIRLGRKEGLPRPCVVNLDNLLTVPKRRLARLIGSLGAAKTDELNRALPLALEIS